MAKILNAPNQKKCVGCELCVLECQRQLKKVGLGGSLIRILKTKKKAGQEYPSFQVGIDPRINDLQINKISNICPTGVFTIEEDNA